MPTFLLLNGTNPTLSQFTLKEMIRQTLFSIAVNENNRLMTGELFEIKDNCLKIVSLDGHRISIRRMPLKENILTKDCRSWKDT